MEYEKQDRLPSVSEEFELSANEALKICRQVIYHHSSEYSEEQFHQAVSVLIEWAISARDELFECAEIIDNKTNLHGHL